MESQKHLFNLPPDRIYLNCARRGPQSKKLAAIGVDAVKRQCNPDGYTNEDFFGIVQEIKVAFSNLISANDPDRIAIIPSASYGLANVANNLNLKKGEKIIVVGEQFPSNVYAWMDEVENSGASIDFIKPPSLENRGQNWNTAILEAIDDSTKMVALGHVHWADGTLFDLKAIRTKTTAHNALLVIDGTQSIGALPFSVQEIQPDALISGSYKWMMGPYSLGVAYYGPAFDGGEPIEKNWINRLNSNDFTNLINYQPLYRPKANRYSMGEQSNFILSPLLLAAIGQLKSWGVENIQHYCSQITKNAVAEWREMGLYIENDAWRGHHLFGIRLNDNFDSTLLKAALEKAKISVSFRGTAMRVSPNVYNEESEVEKLVDCFRITKKSSQFSI